MMLEIDLRDQHTPYCVRRGKHGNGRYRKNLAEINAYLEDTYGKRLVVAVADVGSGRLENPMEEILYERERDPEEFCG